MNLRDNLPLDQLPPEWVPDGMRFVTKAEYERLMTEMLHNRPSSGRVCDDLV